MESAPADLALRRLRRDNALLASANYDLERSNRDLESFALAASHDLAEPLRAITAFSHRLSTRYAAELDADGQECLRFIGESAERMQALIQALLAYARLHQAELHLEPIDTERMVRHLLTTLDNDGRAAVETAGLPQVVADRAQLGQVFQNLLANALKFVDAEQPQIRVSAVRNGDGWRFDVADNGIGIDPLHAERIFEVFQRLHPREEFEGTGIGLANVRRIMQRHGGRAWANGAIDEGATFFIALPEADRVA